MQKKTTVQPQRFGQTWRFFVRRPDYGWSGLWNGAPLTLAPTGNKIFYSRDFGGWKIEENVQGMKTVVWVPEGLLDPAGFEQENLPSGSWWQTELKEVLFDYLKRLWPNSPSVLLGLVMLIGCIALVVQLQTNPEQAAKLLLEGDVNKISLVLIAVLGIPPLVSLWICRRFPARTRLANFLFQLETWLLLITLLLSFSDLKPSIIRVRAQAQELILSAPAP